MNDREKVISTFEKIISVCKEDGCDFVDISFEDAEQILALLKDDETRIQYLNDHIEMCKEEIERIKQEAEEEPTFDDWTKGEKR